MNLSQTTTTRLMEANDAGSHEGGITLVKQIRHVNLTKTFSGMNGDAHGWEHEENPIFRFLQRGHRREILLQPGAGRIVRLNLGGTESADARRRGNAGG